MLKSSLEHCASLHTNKTGCLHGAKQLQNPSKGLCCFCAPNHPTLTHDDLVRLPRVQEDGAPSCVCVFPTYNCVAVGSPNRQLCLFQVHISWPLSHWLVAVPILAAQPAVELFPQVKHILLFLKLHLPKSQCAMGILERRGAMLMRLTFSTEQTRTDDNICFHLHGMSNKSSPAKPKIPTQLTLPSKIH